MSYYSVLYVDLACSSHDVTYIVAYGHVTAACICRATLTTTSHLPWRVNHADALPPSHMLACAGDAPLHIPELLEHAALPAAGRHLHMADKFMGALVWRGEELGAKNQVSVVA